MLFRACATNINVCQLPRHQTIINGHNILPIRKIKLRNNKKVNINCNVYIFRQNILYSISILLHFWNGWTKVYIKKHYNSLIKATIIFFYLFSHHWCLQYSVYLKYIWNRHLWETSARNRYWNTCDTGH